MGRTVGVEINKANALITLGSMYRNAADAIKEYVSNALDEWAKTKKETKNQDQCNVRFTLNKKFITISYNAPGMDEQGFEDALKHVVDSPKPNLNIPQIGRLGIGLWAFNQVGSQATFISKRSQFSPTVKVVLNRDAAEAEFIEPTTSEKKRNPGMTIKITGLFQDPTRRYGPLSQARLKHVLADRFDVYLRTGQLNITITSGKKTTEIKPLRIDLPEVGTRFREMQLNGSDNKVFRTRFWFDPSGNGRVAIRHTGVVIIDDISEVFEDELRDCILTSGLIKGFIDAEFLNPLPARAQFFEDDNLAKLLASLKGIGLELEQETSGFQEAAANEQLQGLFRRATKVAREILSQDEFLDLDLINGLRRISMPRIATPATRKDQTSLGNGINNMATNGLDHSQNTRPGREIIRQAGFEGDVRHRSRLSDGAIEINTNNPDFLALAQVPRSHQVAYVAMLFGKEIIAYNDSSKASEEALEKMAAYGTKVLSQIWQ